MLIRMVFFHPNQEQKKRMHLAEEGISAGFPSPADDFKELRISIDQEVVRNEESFILCKGLRRINARCRS